MPRRTRALESERQGPLGDCPRDCRGDSSKKPPLTQTHALGAAGPLVERRGHPPGQLAAGGIKRTRGGGKIMARVATPRTDKRGCRSSPALPRQNRGTRWADSRRCIQRRPARDQGRHVFAPVACPVRSGRPAILRLLSLDTSRFRRVQSIQDDALLTSVACSRRDGSLLRVLSGCGGDSVAFSPSGHNIVTGTLKTGRIKIWGAAGGSAVGCGKRKITNGKA